MLRIMNNDYVIERNAISWSNGANHVIFLHQSQRFPHQIPNFYRSRKSAKSFQLMCVKPQDHPHPHPYPVFRQSRSSSEWSEGCWGEVATPISSRRLPIASQYLHNQNLQSYYALRKVASPPKIQNCVFLAKKMQDLSTLAARFMVSWLMV